MPVWGYSLVSVMLVSLISGIGILTLSLKEKYLNKIILFMVSFAVGGLFGDAFIHLLPEAFSRLGKNTGTSLLAISGIMIFFVLEKFLRWRHCHIHNEEHIHPVATLNLLGDAVHNFVDGLIIAASYMASIPLGISTTLAVIFHEIPQEIGDFGILIYAGYSVRMALFYNFLCALTSVLGAVVVIIIGFNFENYLAYLIPITAGGFIYIAGSDLIPELHTRCDIRVSSAVGQFIFIVLGVGVMAGL